jgi:heat shock protein HslJ
MAINPLDGGAWRLTAYHRDGAPGALRDLPGDIEVTLAFAGGRVSGRSGCNRYMGEAVVGESGLVFSAIAGTRMMCDPAAMEVEAAYLAALDTVRAWVRQGGALELRDAAGATALRFAPEPADTPGA